MKTTFSVSYATSKTEQTKILIDIDVISVDDSITISLKHTKHQKYYGSGMLIDGADIYSDGIAYRVEDLATDFLRFFKIPELIYQQTHEEFTRRIMEFVDMQRKLRINELKQKKDNTVDGQQLHHVAYLEASKL